jgi:phosphoglycolate phosphatase
MSNGNKGPVGQFAGVRLLIFDLDGTLIDSRLDLVHSVNATLEYMGRAALPHELIESYVGNGVAVLIRKALGAEAVEEDVERGQTYFLSYYREHMLDNTVLYPGVQHALECLGDRTMAVLTNKPVRFSEDILAGLGVAKHFRFVYGGNSFVHKKPDPIGVNLMLRDLDLRPAEAMMVGDSAVDVRTARNSGVWSCGVTYGLGLEGMRNDPPDIMLDSLTELPPYLAGACVPLDAEPK